MSSVITALPKIWYTRPPFGRCRSHHWGFGRLTRRGPCRCTRRRLRRAGRRGGGGCRHRHAHPSEADRSLALGIRATRSCGNALGNTIGMATLFPGPTTGIATNCGIRATELPLSHALPLAAAIYATYRQSSGAAQLLAITGAVAARPIATLGLSHRAAVRSTGHRISGTTAPLRARDLTPGAAPRTRRGRGGRRTPGRLHQIAAPELAERGQATETEESAEHLPAAAAARQCAHKSIESSVVHSLSSSMGATRRWDASARYGEQEQRLSSVYELRVNCSQKEEAGGGSALCAAAHTMTRSRQSQIEGRQPKR
jgi:hypothetical protein